MNEILYRRAVRIGKKRLDEIIGINEIKTSLQQHGSNGREIANAINLMACILYLDRLVFPDNPIGKCYFCYTKLNDSLAGYNCPKEEYPYEAYGVRVKEILEDLEKMLSHNRIILYNQDGSETEDCYDNLPLVSYYQLLLSIAAHEVRHRLQKNGTKLFSSNGNYTGERIKSYVWFTRSLFKAGKDYGEVKDPVLKEEEFDARIVEKLILCALHQGAEEQKLCDIIKIEGQTE